MFARNTTTLEHHSDVVDEEVEVLDTDGLTIAEERMFLKN